MHLFILYHQHSFQTITAAVDSIQSQLAQTGFKCRKNQSHVVHKQKEGPALFPSPVSAQSISIETVASYTYLGIVVDDSRSYKPHIEHLIKTLRLKLGFSSRNRSCFTGKSLLLPPFFYLPWITVT